MVEAINDDCAEPRCWAFEDVQSPFFVVDPDDESTLLGGGAYGAVYAATLHGHKVAAKTLHALRNPDMYGLTGPGSDPAAVASVVAEFTKEAETLAAVDHPHVLKFWGVCFGMTNGLRLPKWIITELLPSTLHAFVRLPGIREALSPWHTLCLAADMAEGIAYLHGLGVIHRDVKPKNVLVSPHGAKLSDLGTAKMVGIAARTAQHTVGPGTAIYHPPEVLAGEYTESIDVFGLGLSVWEIATGRTPPRGGAADSFACAREDQEGNLSLDEFVDEFARRPHDLYHHTDAMAVGWFVWLATKLDRRERISAEQALGLLSGLSDSEHGAVHGLGVAIMQRMVKRREFVAERGEEREGGQPEVMQANTAETIARRAAGDLLQQYTQRRLCRYFADHTARSWEESTGREEDAAATRAALATALGKVSMLEELTSKVRQERCFYWQRFSCLPG